MRLWTWQRAGFDITDPKVTVDSLKHSEYLNDPYFTTDNDRRREVYKQLWTRLGTSQLHWCHTDWPRAEAYGNHLEGYALWELEIDRQDVCWPVCSMAWHWLLEQRETCPPEGFEWIWRVFRKFDSSYHREEFARDFSLAWTVRTIEERWTMLYCADIVPGCTDVLLPHPVDPSHVVSCSVATTVATPQAGARHWV